MKHILIIEDEPKIFKFLKQGLEEEGYAVTVATTGDEGVALFRALSPQLVLLDWMLPCKSGVEVCKTIRQEDGCTPILFLTAKDTIAETVEGLRAGANDYIKKPFSFAELLERIKIHFRPKNESHLLVLGNIELNIRTHTVSVESEEVPFTQREFELLAFLVQNRGRVCTRDELIERVWGVTFKYDTGVIDVFINAIRKKLKLNKHSGYIKTVRGIGYSVCE